MSPIKTSAVSGARFAPKSGLGNFRNQTKRGITSIASQAGNTSAFHQLGDAVSHTDGSSRSIKTYSSINSAIKASKSPLKPTDTTSKPKINSTFKPLI